MRHALAIWALLLGSPVQAETSADRFAPRHGLNFEIWTDWLTTEQMVTTPGFLDQYPDWRHNASPEGIAALAPMGFDFVRLPMDPAPLLRLGPGPRQDALIAQIVEGAALVQSTGLKVIVDMHSIPRAGESWGTDSIVSDAALFAALVALVGKVATALNGMDPDRTALEVLNEPTGDCDAIAQGAGPMTWPDQLTRLYRAAPSAAPDLPLILSGACWGGVPGLTVVDPARFDANVLWSFHSYDPFLFTHQAALWSAGPNAHFSGLPYSPETIDDALAARLVAEAVARAVAAGATDMTPEVLAKAMADYRRAGRDAVGAEVAEAAAWADRHGIPQGRLILGEFGAMRGDFQGVRFNTSARDAFLEDKRRAAETAGIGWAVWVWTGSFGVAEDDARRALAPGTCAALGLTC